MINYELLKSLSLHLIGNPLHRYAAQRPSVLLVNHRDRVLFLTPVPLDQATIGEATFSCPVVCWRASNDELTVTVLANPPCAESIFACGQNLGDQGDITAKLSSCT